MKRFLILVLYFILVYHSVFCEKKIDDLSFTQTDVTQVLKVISEIFGITIVPDKEVTGLVTRYFKDTTLEETLIYLLDPLEYTYEIKDNVYFVRKKPAFSVEYNDQTQLFNIDAQKGNLQEILDKMSSLSEKTILFNGNSDDKISIHIFNKKLGEAVQLLSGSLDYEIEEKNGVFQVNKVEDDTFFTDNNRGSRNILIRGTEDSVTLKFRNQSSKDIILALFSKFKKQLSLFSRSSNMIPYLDVKNIAFDELVEIIVNFSGQAYTKAEDKYFVYDSQGVKEVNKYIKTVSYKLKNLDYKRFLQIIPSQVIPSSLYKIDSNNNEITIFGSPSQVNYYLGLIKDIDMSRQDYQNRIFKLKYLDAKKIQSYLPDKFKSRKFSVIAENNLFYAYMSDHDYNELNQILTKIDTAHSGYKYKFKHVKPEDVMKNLIPGYINKNQIKMNPNDSSLVFNVSEDTKIRLFEFFDSIDVPAPVIRYQLLIIEYLKENNFKFDWGIGLKKGDTPFSVEAGIFNNESDSIYANFDIPTVFGYYFSAELQTKLLQKKAKIQMSTEVFGVSGENVTLTNTLEQHYQDIKKDKDGNETSTWNSILSGLNLEIKGRSSSSHEVFIEVSARISDTIPKGKAPPDKLEKSVKSAVATRTGKPIILGGLKNKKESRTNNVIPGLGQIPILGNVFKTHDNTYTDSEFIIYIIPFVMKRDEDIKKERNLYVKKIYDYYHSKI